MPPGVIRVVLKCCSYCLSFAGDAPEYGDFSITHGLCAACEAKRSSMRRSQQRRPVDILIGMIAPIIDQIGEDAHVAADIRSLNFK
ncbi:hypothetical protein [Bradyrhizobium sp. USDA 4451]